MMWYNPRGKSLTKKSATTTAITSSPSISFIKTYYHTTPMDPYSLPLCNPYIRRWLPDEVMFTDSKCTSAFILLILSPTERYSSAGYNLEALLVVFPSLGLGEVYINFIIVVSVPFFLPTPPTTVFLGPSLWMDRVWTLKVSHYLPPPPPKTHTQSLPP